MKKIQPAGIRMSARLLCAAALLAFGCRKEMGTDEAMRDGNIPKTSSQTSVTATGDYVMASFNIRYDAPDPGQQAWSVRRALVKDMILKYGFDVFGVQEAEGNQITNMQSDLPAFAKVGVGRDGNSTSEHSAIFYRTARFNVLSSGTFWLSPGAPTTATGPSWDAAYKRICTWAKFQDKVNGQQFWVFNSHFDHVGTTARANSASLVLQQMQAKIGYQPAVFMGDLNCDQNSAPFLSLKNSSLLEETWDIAPVKSPVSRQTANAWNINPAGNSQIDHVFTGTHWRVTSRKVMWDNYDGIGSYNDVLPSDHFPVVVELSIFPKTVADFNFDRKTDAAVFANGVWKVNGMADATWGEAGDIPVPMDYDGDNKIDRAIYRPSTRYWWVENVTVGEWGQPNDLPVPGDYNGDNKVDYTVWRPSNTTWYVLGGATQQWGDATDIPVPGDYNGDGKTDFAVFRQNNATWYVYAIGNTAWGNSGIGDIPVPGDYNGDGKTEYAIFRPSTGTWWIKDIGNYVHGQAGDIPAPGDYNGDRITDLAVWRPSTNQFLIHNGATITMAAGYKPVALPWHIRKFFFP